MTQYRKLLWVVQASGETLSVGGSQSLIVLYLTIFAKTFCTLVCDSECRAVLTSVDLADVWGQCRISASICHVYQYGPQLTRQPLVAYYCRRGLARWSFSYVRGHMRPILTFYSLMFRSSRIEFFSLVACFTDILRFWDV